MKSWILAGATILLMQGLDAREPWGPPPICPRPKVDCCPKPCAKPCEKPAAKPCAPPCPQPCPPTQICPVACPEPCPAWPTPVLYAAYNYPAAIQTRCPVNLFFDVSFTYWQASEENLELGVTDSQTTAQLAGIDTIVNGNVINQDFAFKPGFQLGAGYKFDYDHWDVFAEYTWFRATNQTSATAPANTSTTTGFINPLLGASALQSVSGTFTTPRYTSASSSWKCNMDFLDALLGRSYYVGMKLIFHPYFGMRGAWIRQGLSARYVNPVVLPGAAADHVRTYNMHQHTHSWAVGFKTGLNMDWMLAYGLRLYGCGSGDILYTRYTSLKTSESSADTTGGVTTVTPFKNSQSQVGSMRTHLDLEMGLGWGTYFLCNKWYLDMSAGYGFQVFFDQNMFRHYGDDVMVANSFMSNGNLYIQGLTIKARLDF